MSSAEEHVRSVLKAVCMPKSVRSKRCTHCVGLSCAVSTAFKLPVKSLDEPICLGPVRCSTLTSRAEKVRSSANKVDSNCRPRLVTMIDGHPKRATQVDMNADATNYLSFWCNFCFLTNLVGTITPCHVQSPKVGKNCGCRKSHVTYITFAIFSFEKYAR